MFSWKKIILSLLFISQSCLQSLSKVLLLSFSLSPKQFAHKGGKMAPFVSLSLLLLFLNHPLLSLSTNPEGMAYCFISLSPFEPKPQSFDHKPWPRIRTFTLALDKKKRRRSQKEVSFTVKLWRCLEEQKKKRKFLIKDWREAKRKKKVSDQRLEESKRKTYRNVVWPNNVWIMYGIVTSKNEKKSNLGNAL